jgi:pseudouridine-5'-monophosphatase
MTVSETIVTKPVKCVLFDLDGLLLDTEIIYTEVTQQIVGRYGKVFDWSIKANMLGRPSADSARYLVSALDLPITAQDYMTERDGLLRVKFPDCVPLAGAERLIRHLHGAGIPISVATSSTRDLFDLKVTRHHDWFNLFNKVVAGDDPEIRNGKPAPDIFLVAASRLGIDPEHALVFEDAPSGLQAGVDAGMQVVAIPDPHMDQSRYQQATQVLTTLEQFNPADFGLPAY